MRLHQTTFSGLMQLLHLFQRGNLSRDLVHVAQRLDSSISRVYHFPSSVGSQSGIRDLSRMSIILVLKKSDQESSG